MVMKRGFFFEGKIEDEIWRREWKDMPEFIQEDLHPFRSITVHFRNKKDMEEFAELVEQGITVRTQSIYYPKEEIEGIMNREYMDSIEGEEKD